MKRVTVLTILICSIYVLISILAACTSGPAGTVTATKTVTQPAEKVTKTITPPTVTVTETKTPLTEKVTETITLPATTVTETPPAVTITETITVTPLPPILTWVEKPGVVVEFHYAASILTGCTVYQYFEVTDGSGEVEITAAIGDNFNITFIENSEITNTFFVADGNLYRLSIGVSIQSFNPSDPTELKSSFDIIIGSPDATSSGEVTVGGGYFRRVGLEEMNLEPWQ